MKTVFARLAGCCVEAKCDLFAEMMQDIAQMVVRREGKISLRPCAVNDRSIQGISTEKIVVLRHRW